MLKTEDDPNLGHIFLESCLNSMTIKDTMAGMAMQAELECTIHNARSESMNARLTSLPAFGGGTEDEKCTVGQGVWLDLT